MILDNEAWYSTTPRAIAEHQAKACFAQVGRENIVKERVVLDAFCGVGGNSIAFAKAGYKVIGCDIDSEKLKMATENAQSAGVLEIDFVCCNFIDILSTTRVDIIFLSPPWGGPNYTTSDLFTLSESQIGSISSTELINRALSMSRNVVCFLPRNTDYVDLLNYTTQSFKVELHAYRDCTKAVTLYFGNQI